jgi:hypothetical protein
MTETTVVDRRRQPWDVYIGRGSPFGNPYPITHEVSREQVLRWYKQDFIKKIEKDEVFRHQVLSLKGKRLGCYCKPLPCHGDIIKEWIEENT